MGADLPIRLLCVEGTDYEIGYQQGEMFRDTLRLVAALLLPNAGKYFGPAFETLKGHAEGLREYVPASLCEEMQGIADGAGVPYTSVLILNTLPDAGVLYSEGAILCTNIGLTPAATRASRVYHVRSTDWKNGRALSPASFLICRKAGGERPLSTITVTSTGFAGALTVCNERRVALSMVSGHTPDASTTGIPMMLAARQAAENGASGEAVADRLEDFEYMCAYNFLVSDGPAQQVLAVEKRPGAQGRVHADNGWLSISGMCLEKEMAKAQLVSPIDLIRQLRSIQLLAEKDGEHDEQSLIDILRDRVNAVTFREEDGYRCICNKGTLHSIVMDLSHGEFWLSLGPAPAPMHPFVRGNMEQVFGLDRGAYVLEEAGIRKWEQPAFPCLFRK